MGDVLGSTAMARAAPLQIVDILVDVDLPKIAAGLMLVGFGFLVFGILRESDIILYFVGVEYDALQRRFPSRSYALVAAGSVILFYHLYTQFSELVVVLLVLGAQFLGGFAAVRSLRKLRVYQQRATEGVRSLRTPYDAGGGSGGRLLEGVASFVYSRALFFALSLLITLLSGWAAVVFLIENGAESVAYVLLVVFTFLSLGASISGVLWKVWGIRDEVRNSVIVGLALSVGGAEVFNFAAVTTEIQLFVAGKVVFVVAYLLALVVWFSDSIDVTALSLDRLVIDQRDR
ncbi:hypothetical protein ACFQL9_13095 [Halobaculum lipolyticum]|uniref:Uncharacterized protein n=1 Tax=Halobaculum lipolyticum TaxID=3032001 RepID=A0ABD5WJA8_9EURY